MNAAARKRRFRRRSKQAQEPREPKVPHVPKRYGVIFYDTLAEAKADLAGLAVKAQEVDQLNIVIRAESEMDDAELLAHGAIYAGSAWTIIHERRQEEGWYNEPH